MRRPAHPALQAVSLLILTALAGCDNVRWGGVQMEVVPPPPPASMVPVAPDEQLSADFGLPRGPVLFQIQQTPDGSLLLPVAEVTGDSMHALRRPAGVAPSAFEEKFRETVLPLGAQFRVYRRGAPVGTFVVQRAGPVNRCGVPTAYGNATVVAAAADAPRFLAFREGLNPQVNDDFNPPQVDGSIRTYASIDAERLILQAGLPRPRSWQGAQRDLQAIEIVPGGHPEMATTYLVGDSLAVGPADPRGYSVFYIADYETKTGYTPIYSEVLDYRKTGKAAPRLVDYLNWNDRGPAELLVQVFGRDQSWFEAIGQRHGRWEKIWEGNRCG
ncbi:MAG TPA: hypothetical protein VFL93_06835 [Longimicrobiaceae bacterium]|nr:hypothetical protein [Longimicrobiaceae bacterium]